MVNLISSRSSPIYSASGAHWRIFQRSAE